MKHVKELSAQAQAAVDAEDYEQVQTGTDVLLMENVRASSCAKCNCLPDGCLQEFVTTALTASLVLIGPEDLLANHAYIP